MVLGVVWALALLLLLTVDSAVLVAAILSKSWPWLAFLDTEVGRIVLGALIAVLAFSVLRCALRAENPTHLVGATSLMTLAALGLVSWGSVTLFGLVDHAPFLTQTWGKWVFTVACTLLFIHWSWAFEDEVTSRIVAMRIHSFAEEHGRLLGFLYASSGLAYMATKLLLLGVLLVVRAVRG